MEGVLAINKPFGVSSAQVIRDLQSHFNPSRHFAPWIDAERRRRGAENSFQRRRRSAAKKTVQVKIGHGGTLDPAATGVLVLGIGSGTKELHHFLGGCKKSYEAVVLFGAATDSYDGAGKVIGRKAWKHVTEEKVREALGQFRGKIMQRPPIFSALKVDGKKLYEYARAGKEVPKEIEERAMQVEELELEDWMNGGKHGYKTPTEEAGTEEKAVASNLLHLESEAESSNEPSSSSESKPKHAGDLKRKRGDAEDSPGVPASTPKKAKPTSSGVKAESDVPAESHAPSRESDHEQERQQQSTSEDDGDSPPAAKIRVISSSGFYVRSLCHDLGQAVGSMAFMASLVRTRQGIFELEEDVLTYDDLDKGEEIWSPKVDRLLTDWNNRSKPHLENATIDHVSSAEE